ncbi:hypothetical protein [Caballeronia sp. 15715]|uniref:hypothetical protein n=1 Tax=unclassified Caballeronia TaxID=2646786 RepID=UPI0039E36ECF
MSFLVLLTRLASWAQARNGNDYSPEDAALGADADEGDDFRLSSGESESAVPDVSGTSPVLSTEEADDAAAGAVALLAGNGGKLAGRAGIGGATGI